MIPRLILPLLLTFPLAGCDTPTVLEEAAGTYELRTIGGGPLPRAIGNEEIVAGTVTLVADGSYAMTSLIRIRNPGGAPVVQTRSASGWWGRDGSRIQLHVTSVPTTGFPDLGTLHGYLLTLGAAEVASVYHRR